MPTRVEEKVLEERRAFLIGCYLVVVGEPDNLFLFVLVLVESYVFRIRKHFWTHIGSAFWLVCNLLLYRIKKVIEVLGALADVFVRIGLLHETRCSLSVLVDVRFHFFQPLLVQVVFVGVKPLEFRISLLLLKNFRRLDYAIQNPLPLLAWCRKSQTLLAKLLLQYVQWSWPSV